MRSSRIKVVDNVRSIAAGHWTLELHDDASLRSIRFDGVEVVREIKWAVRDVNWGTVEGAVTWSAAEAGDRLMCFQLHAHHDDGGIDVASDGELVITETELVFSLEGVAMTSFQANRIGLVVLHPLAGVAGQPCRLEDVLGQVATSTFPAMVAPHQPFRNVRSITNEPAPGMRVEVRLDGEAFETEDQRNWTDASFKTYGPPLERPFPASFEAHERLHQRVSVSVATNGRRRTRLGAAQATVRFEGEGTALPRLGTILPPGVDPEPYRDLLRACGLEHLRVDVDLVADGHEATLTAAARVAELDVAVALDEGNPAHLEALRRLGTADISHLLCFSTVSATSREETLRAARRALGSVRLVGGTDHYFAEFNRNRFDQTLVDAGTFSITPQVHAFSDESVIQTVESYPAVISTARSILGSAALHVSPLTLRPRRNPNATVHDPDAEEAFSVDPRQTTPFAAAWIVAALVGLAGIERVTVMELCGPRGIASSPDAHHPVADALTRLAGVAGGVPVAAAVSHPDIAAVAGRFANTVRAVVANLQPTPREITIQGTRMRFEPYEVRSLTVSGAKERP